MAAADVFTRNRPKPQWGKQQGDCHRNRVDVGDVIRAKIGGAFGQFGRPAVVHGEEAQPQEDGNQTKCHDAEPVDKCHCTATQAVQLCRAEQGKRRQQPNEVVLQALRIDGEQGCHDNQPRQAQNAPIFIVDTRAAERPCCQRPGRQGKPQQVFQIIGQVEGRLNLMEAAEYA